MQHILPGSSTVRIPDRSTLGHDTAQSNPAVASAAHFGGGRLCPSIDEAELLAAIAAATVVSVDGRGPPDDRRRWGRTKCLANLETANLLICFSTSPKMEIAISVLTWTDASRGNPSCI